MSRTSIGVLAAVLLAGCSGDPEWSRLKPGVEGMIAVPKFDDMSNSGMNFAYMRDLQRDETIEVPEGTKVRVIADDEKPRPAMPIPGRKPDGKEVRFVRVKVIDGRCADVVGRVARDFIKPL